MGILSCVGLLFCVVVHNVLSHLAEEDRAGRFTLIVLLLSCDSKNGKKNLWYGYIVFYKSVSLDT